MNWFAWSLLSALFAAATAIFAKIGVEGVDTNLATAIRTSVVLFFALDRRSADAWRRVVHAPFRKNMDVPYLVGNRDWTLLALLFSCSSTRPRLKSGSSRQAQFGLRRYRGFYLSRREDFH